MLALLERLDAQEISELVNHFTAPIEPQVVPGFTPQYLRSVQGFACDIDDLGINLTMSRTEWVPTGKFRASRLGRAVIRLPYPDLEVSILDRIQPDESRLIRTRDDYQNAPVFVRSGPTRTGPSRRPVIKDLEVVNRTLLWIVGETND